MYPLYNRSNGTCCRAYGEAIGGTEMDYTVVTANTFQNVGATTVVTVPSCGSLIVSIGNVGTTAAIVKDANIIIKRIS